jgi:hypothetical protein
MKSTSVQKNNCCILGRAKQDKCWIFFFCLEKNQSKNVEIAVRGANFHNLKIYWIFFISV